MTFVKGNKLSKGRPKGAKDKRREFYDVVAMLERRGLDPIEALAEIAQDMTLDTAIRLKAILPLADRISPPVKAVQMDISSDQLVEGIDKLKEEFMGIFGAFKREY